MEYFRDNPKLGDGNYNMEIKYKAEDLYLRDNPKLGDGKDSIYFSNTKITSDFRDNPKLGDGKPKQKPEDLQKICGFQR